MLQIVSDEAAREAIELNRTLEETLATLPSMHTVPPATVRAARRAGNGIFGMPEFLAEAAWVQADGIALRVIRPPTPARGVYFHIHGGGWMLGGARYARPSATRPRACHGPRRGERGVPPRLRASVPSRDR